MKCTLLLFILLSTSGVRAQKYVLLDQHISEPVKYSNTVTSADNFNDLFPVEKKLLPEFLKAIMLAAGERIDYVITSTCDNVKISMHLSDAKLSNESNAFFIKTWIKYIETAKKDS